MDNRYIEELQFLASGVAQLKKDMRTVATSLDGVDEKLDDLNKSAKANVGAMQGLRGGFKLLKGALVGIGIGKLTGEMSRLAAANETNIITFTNFTGSAKEAQKVLNQLQKEAARTPFQLEQYQGAARTLLAFNVEQEKLLGISRQLADVTAGVNGNLEEIAYVYGQINLAQGAYTEDLNQLAQRGIPIYSELAAILEETGKGANLTARDIKKFASEGQISADLVAKAFQRMTSEGGKFNNLADKLADTTTGKLSTFKDNIAAVGRELGGTLNKALVEVIDLASRWLGFTKDQATVLREEQAEVNVLAGILANSSNSQEARIKAYEKLAEINPEIVKGIDAEAVNTNRLNLALERVNDSYRKRIDLAVAQARVNTLQKEQNDLIQTTVDLEVRLPGLIADRINSFDAGTRKIVSGYEQQVKASEIANLGLSEQIRLIEKVNALPVNALDRVAFEALKERDSLLSSQQELIAAAARKQNEAQEALGKQARTTVDATRDELEATLATLQASLQSADAARAASIQASIDVIQGKIKALTSTVEAATGPAAGSIDALEAKIKRLEEAYKATGDAARRAALQEQISTTQQALINLKFKAGTVSNLEESIKLLKDQVEQETEESRQIELQTQITFLQAQLDRASFNMQFEQLNEVLTERAKEVSEAVENSLVVSATDLPARDFETEADRYLAQETIDLVRQRAEELRSVFTDLRTNISEGLRGIAVDTAAGFAESIGAAIATGQGLADAFKQVLEQILVTAPKMVGMALLNAAANPLTPFPANLALAAGGVALLGISGIASGLLKKAEPQETPAPVSGGGSVNTAAQAAGLGSFQSAGFQPEIKLNAVLGLDERGQRTFVELVTQEIENEDGRRAG